MSADVTVVFYGVRVAVDSSDEDCLDLLGTKKHPLMLKARKHGLDCYWANFGGTAELYYLFIGKKLGLLGLENDSEVSLSNDELRSIVASTDVALTHFATDGVPRLYAQWMADS